MPADKKLPPPDSELERLRVRNEELAFRLEEAEETLRAIREGEVDALIVSGSRGEQVFSLAGSDSVYRRIVETMAEAAFTATPDGTILFCNAQFGQLVGRPLEQIVGRRVQELAAPDADAADALLIAACDEPARGRLVLSDAQGQPVPVHVAANRLDQPDGSSICLVAADLRELESSTELIQQLRRQQEALRASEERFRRVFENAATGIAITDWQGHFEHCNQAYCELLGYTQEELRQREFTSLIHPDDRPADLAVTQRLKAGEVPFFQIENRYVRKDGDVVWVHKYVSVLDDAAGDPAHVLAMVTDVTERKLAEEALRASEERFRVMFEGHRAVMLLIEPHTGAIVDANAAAVAFYGHSRQRLRSMRIEQINQLPPEEVAARRRQALSLGNNQFVFPHRFADGRLRWVEVYSSPVTIQGRPMLFSVIHDVTARHEAEEALKAAKENLEVLVQERTSELSRTVDTLQEEVERRLAAESHLRMRSEQLRALASELTLAEQRERRRLAEMLHDNLQQLLVGAKFRLTRLGRTGDAEVRRASDEVQDLLDESIECSRTLTGELSPPILHQAGLSPALGWLVVWMQQRHALAVELQTDESAEPRSEEVRVLLFQSARELLFNVVKHAKVNKARMRLRRAGEQIELAVSDDGVGFDPSAVIPRAGRPGGFGLFSIRERLDLLGGRLEIDSAPGGGSRFRMLVPDRVSAAAAAAAPPTLADVRISSVAAPQDAQAAARQAIRVMLVDDHVVVRQGLSFVLREEPDMAIVAEASDGLRQVVCEAFGASGRRSPPSAPTLQARVWKPPTAGSVVPDAARQRCRNSSRVPSVFHCRWFTQWRSLGRDSPSPSRLASSAIGSSGATAPVSRSIR